jgi:hypothetical protein
MVSGGFLPCHGQAEHVRFSKQASHERDARRSAVTRPEAVRHAHGRMPGEIRQQELVATERGGHQNVHSRHGCVHLSHEKGPDTIRAHVFHGGDELALSKHVRPRILDLSHQEIVAAAPGQFVKRRARAV